jgi:hypothetical protein
MARLRFIQGAITGKLGEFVGSRWKGINYIKTFTKPSNPRTEGQISIRKVFKYLSLFASALFSKGLLVFVPPARRMTERNSVFKANKSMLTNKTFVPSALQVAIANIQVMFETVSCLFNTSNIAFTFKALISPQTGTAISGFKAHLLVYDTVKHVLAFSWSQNITIPSTGIYSLTVNGNAPDNFNSPEGSQLSDCRFYLFVTGTDEKQKKFISSTFSVPVTL